MEEALSEVELLRHQVAELRFALGLDRQFPVRMGLTGKQREIMGLLSRKEFASRECIYSALYSGNADGDMPCDKIIDVLISKLRKKSKEMGLDLKTQYGVGWYFDAASKARLEELCSC